MNPAGEILGHIMEEEVGTKGMIVRQLLKNRRPFKATILSVNGDVLLSIRRPFSLINSRIYVSVDGVDIGEVQQSFHVYKRRYQFYLSREGEMSQFGDTDEGFLAWDFRVKGEKGETISSINRCGEILIF